VYVSPSIACELFSLGLRADVCSTDMATHEKETLPGVCRILLVPMRSRAASDMDERLECWLWLSRVLSAAYVGQERPEHTLPRHPRRSLARRVVTFCLSLRRALDESSPRLFPRRTR
jgi:hypothetical protein